VWRIPPTKGNRPQTIPLVSPAVAILSRRREQANGEWVFASGKVPGEHVKVFRTQWTRLLQRAEPADLRPHDVRRTLGNWMTKGGTSLPVVKKVLGHQDLPTTLIYTRRTQTRAGANRHTDVGGWRCQNDRPLTQKAASCFTRTGRSASGSG
jgi:integrase